MSTFSGKLQEKELTFIAIDYFESQLLNCNTLMLSHCHSMVFIGIQEQCFHTTFNNIKNMVLYASLLTEIYLKQNKT